MTALDTFVIDDYFLNFADDYAEEVGLAHGSSGNIEIVDNKVYRHHCSLDEYVITFIASRLGVAPKVLAYDAERKTLVLERIMNPTYVDPTDTRVLKQIAKLKIYGINHGDLRKENCLLDEQNNVWIIDYEFSTFN